MSALLESQALHGRVRAVIRAFEDRTPSPEPFDAIACDLARFQARHVAGYARLCVARGVDPSALTRGSEVPAVPTDAFRLAPVFAFHPRQAASTFLTSGTSLGARGAHRIRDLSTYDAGALAFARAMLAAGLPARVPVVVVGPSEVEASDSSLAHMCGLFVRAFGDTESVARPFFVRDGRLDVDALRSRVLALRRRGPATIVLSTSFALVHLLDALGDDVLPLPAGSRVMQTGGFKGRSREVAAVDLRRAMARLFAIDERAIAGEYGMSELSSQFWEATLVDNQARGGVYVAPPWARVVPVHPETLEPMPEGEPGIARIEDLANVDSAFAVLTQDRVRGVPGGFEFLSRSPGAPPRGCSIALDEMLSTDR